MITVLCQKCSLQTSIESLRHGSRCPQCSHDIWDSGTQSASGLPASPSWFYTIGPDQCGPITVGELRRLALCGLLSGAYIWRDGLAGWAPAVQLEDLCATAARESTPLAGAVTPAPQGQPPAILPPPPPPFPQHAGSPVIVDKPTTTTRAVKSKAAVGRGADNVRSAQLVIAGVVGVCLAGILLMWVSLSYRQAQERKRAAERRQEGKSLTSTLLNAVKENVERGLEEAARLERLKEIEAQTQRSASGAAPEGHGSGTDDHRAVIAHGGAGGSVTAENRLNGSTVIFRNGDQTTVIRDGKVVEQTTGGSNRSASAPSRQRGSSRDKTSRPAGQPAGTNGTPPSDDSSAAAIRGTIGEAAGTAGAAVQSMQDAIAGLNERTHAAKGRLRPDTIGLGYLNDNYRALRHWRAGKVLTLPYLKTWWEEDMTGSVPYLLKRFLAVSGIEAKDVEFITGGYGINSRSSNRSRVGFPFTEVVRTKIPIQQSKILEVARASEKVAAGTQSYYPAPGGLALYFPNDRTIVYGSETEIRYALLNPGAKWLRAVVDWIDFEKHDIVYINRGITAIPMAEVRDFDSSTTTLTHMSYTPDTAIALLREAELKHGVDENKRHWSGSSRELDVEVRSRGPIVERVVRLGGMTSEQQFKAMSRAEGILQLRICEMTSGYQPGRLDLREVEATLLAAHSQLQRRDLTDRERRQFEKQRLNSLNHLGAYGWPDSVPILVKFCREIENKELRDGIITSFTFSHNPQAVIGLAHVLDLADLSSDLKRRSLVDALRGVFKHYLIYGDSDVFIAICHIMETLQDDCGIGFLGELAADPSRSADVRLAARRALAASQGRPLPGPKPPLPSLADTPTVSRRSPQK